MVQYTKLMFQIIQHQRRITGPSLQDQKHLDHQHLDHPHFEENQKHPKHSQEDLKHRLKHRWVFKSPQNAELLEELLVVYPEAKFIFTQRRPFDVLKSLLAMLTYVGGVQGRVTPEVAQQAARFWVHRTRWSLCDKLIPSYSSIPPENRVNVRFEDLMADTMKEVERVLRFGGLEVDGQVLAHIDQVRRRNPRTTSRLKYDVESFGFTEEYINELFTCYTEYFGL